MIEIIIELVILTVWLVLSLLILKELKKIRDRICNIEADDLINGLNDNVERLTEWERNFLQSVHEWRGKGIDITENQLGVLQAIWDRRMN